MGQGRGLKTSLLQVGGAKEAGWQPNPPRGAGKEGAPQGKLLGSGAPPASHCKGVAARWGETFVEG